MTAQDVAKTQVTEDVQTLEKLFQIPTLDALAILSAEIEALLDTETEPSALPEELPMPEAINTDDVPF